MLTINERIWWNHINRICQWTSILTNVVRCQVTSVVFPRWRRLLLWLFLMIRFPSTALIIVLVLRCSWSWWTYSIPLMPIIQWVIKLLLGPLAWLLPLALITLISLRLQTRLMWYSVRCGRLFFNEKSCVILVHVAGLMNTRFQHAILSGHKLYASIFWDKCVWRG